MCKVTQCPAMARRAKRSPESQTQDTRSQNVRRKIRAEATGAEGNLQRLRELERKREYMRRYRERLRIRTVQSPEGVLSGLPLVGPDDSDVRRMDEDGLRECPVEDDIRDAADVQRHYLPVHQEHAIHDFLDRLRLIQDDVHECTTCLERYHGMQMHGTQCSRCHNEVRATCMVADLVPVLRLSLIVDTVEGVTSV